MRAVRDETPTLKAVELDVPAEVAAAYTRPGQYVVLHPEGADKPVFMALASAPGAAPLELLVGPAAAARLPLEAGAEIAMDAPGGKGFPIELAEGKDVLLFAVGSGMSAIRSVIEHIRAHRDRYGSVVLFAGAHTDADHAYVDRTAEWEAAHVEVVRTTSKPWVQDVFRGSPRPTGNAVAFVCGMKEMVQGVTAALGEAGLAADQVRQNF